MLIVQFDRGGSSIPYSTVRVAPKIISPYQLLCRTPTKNRHFIVFADISAFSTDISYKIVRLINGDSFFRNNLARKNTCKQLEMK